MSIHEDSEEIKHPSFGQLLFIRTSGHSKFYGSELESDYFITMSVQQSHVERDLSKDWYYTSGLPLIEVRMTANQFSEAITSMNQGSGVPCTIEWVDGKKVEDYPGQESRKEFIHRKFKDRMVEFAKNVTDRQNAAKALVNKKTLSKKDITELGHHLDWLTQEITSNIPFFIKCFQETADEIVLDAKSEIEAAIQHKINVLGLAELHKQNKLLEKK